MNKILVTELEYDKAAEIFASTPDFECLRVPADEDALAAAIERTSARYVIVGVNKYVGALYDTLPAGGVIARFGVGHDGIDKTAAQARGILCANTPGVLDDSVAECAVGLMLAAARHLATCAAENRSGHWKNRVGGELAGKTLAVIGCGNIGRKTAAIAKLGFRMTIAGCDPLPPREMAPFDTFSAAFAVAVRDADFVSIHIPDIPATRDFVNADRLAALKESAVLINTARGNVLDEDALYDAIRAGTIAGAALDVFKREPYAPQSAGKDLRTLTGILMTPHLGSSTREACARMATAALHNIRLAVAGRVDEMTRCR